MKRLSVTTLVILIALVTSAQQSLSMEEFLNIVRRYHPVAKQAALDVEIAKADVTSARGAFDPRFENDMSRKEFDGLLYYDHQITTLEIPTWYGVDFVAGIESLSGNRTSTPDTKGNTSYVGLSVPVGKGLLIDGRRAALQQARIFRDLSAEQQRIVVNDLLFEAAKTYSNWWQHFQVSRVFSEATRNAEERFRLVKSSYVIGERPAIDTIEALAQLQTMQIRSSEIQLDLANARLALEVYLWQESGSAYSLPQTVAPAQAVLNFAANIQLDTLLYNLPSHPELQQYRFTLKALEVERRLKFQSFLPSIYLKYNQLNKSHDFGKVFSTPLMENNYRYGVAVSVPLRLSEGRGEYRKAKLKIEQTELEQTNKQVALETRLRQYFNEWTALRQQINLQQQAVQSYAALQRGEQIRFENGESSLFMVNLRELKTLEAQQKLAELQSKEQKAAAATMWATGVLAQY